MLGGGTGTSRPEGTSELGVSEQRRMGSTAGPSQPPLSRPPTLCQAERGRAGGSRSHGLGEAGRSRRPGPRRCINSSSAESLGLPWWLRWKSLPATPETWVRSLGRKDPLENGLATHSSILAWETPWMEEPGGLQSMGSQRLRHD